MKKLIKEERCRVALLLVLQAAATSGPTVASFHNSSG